ncbi:DnaD domain protein [Halobacillus sp. K22]|uniref:DnaD domain protein n=1 Tax=Halobacillus sp. K22 TaxID=3457431 RepID=UPI003FCCED51
MSQWCAALSDELVIESMKMALMQNKIFFKYCEGILRKWEQLGVKSLEEVRMQEAVWRSKRKGICDSEKYGMPLLAEEGRRENEYDFLK